MKQIKKILILLILCIVFSGCGKKEKYELALITDIGTVMDGSYNEATWDGLLKYSEESGKSIAYYQPATASTDSYLDSIKEAISAGASVVVCQGDLFGEAVYIAQNKYPKVRFFIIDCEPHNADYSDLTIADNTTAIMFKEEQAGFLAGYAAVRDGFTNIGFMGGTAQDAVVRYGYGYVQGADYAAIELGRMISISYCYGNTFEQSETIREIVSDWYMDGCQVIFACAGEMGKSVMYAADEHSGYVIGVDLDQSMESETVITSALKHLENAVYTGVKGFYDGEETGGTIITMEAANGGIGLEMDNARFNSFNEEQYNAMFDQIVAGEIVPYAETNIGNTFDLELVNTTVNYYEIQ